jgi:hypothetical protein
LTPEQTKQQSITAYTQHCDLWRENAKHVSSYKMKSFSDLELVGVGKAVVCVANGYSFEENIELLKKYKDNIDIMACDKTLGHLLENGIKPTYCVVCDARVSYERYMEKWADQLQDTILLTNVCANPKWVDNGNWKDRYFFVNMDVMHYEEEFMQLSGCVNKVTAGTNVSNMMVVLLTQCTNQQRKNVMGYDKIILIGFDYSWRLGGKYYAFDEDGGGKSFYMRHVYGLSPSGAMLYTSNNLNASASWMNDYIKCFKIPVAQCSGEVIADFNAKADFEACLKYRFRTTDLREIRNKLDKRKELEASLKKIDDRLKDISKSHYYAHLAVM